MEQTSAALTSTENVAKDFVHYIAQSRRQDFLSSVSQAKFFFFLMDESTDQINAESILLLVLWYDHNGYDEKVHTRMSLLCVHKPQQNVTAEGMFQSLQYGLECIGIESVTEETSSKLVGIATDGAAANVASGGLNGLVERELQWIFCMWCLAHRLELVIRDGLVALLLICLMKCSFGSTTFMRNLPRSVENWRALSMT